MGQRLIDRSPRPVARALVVSDLERIAVDLVRRIRHLRHTLSGGVYVLADRAGNIYLVSESASTAPRVLRRMLQDVVGLYTITNALVLHEDLIKHLSINGSEINLPAVRSG